MLQFVSPRIVLLMVGLTSIAGAAIDVRPVNGQESPAQSKQADTSQIDVSIEDAEASEIHVPESLTMRVRILQLDPFEPTQIQYKYGGWGSPGDRVYGYFFKPASDPKQVTVTEKLDDLLDGASPTKKVENPKPKFDGLKGGRNVDPRVRQKVEKPPLFELGEWTLEIPLTQFVPGGATNPRFLQVFGGDGGDIGNGRASGGGRNWVGAARDFKVEFEFRYQGKPIKAFTVDAPDGPIAPIVIPYGALTGTTQPTDPAFLNNLTSLATYVQRRADWAASQSWAEGPKPKHFAMVTNLGGYGPTHRLGVRYAEPAIVEQEARILRAMGINGFQSGPSILVEQAMRHEGLGAPFDRNVSAAAHGYPVPGYVNDTVSDDRAGCPFAPGVESAKQAAAAEVLATLRAHRGLFMLYGTTVDEIGVVIDQSKEGKTHLSVCPHCRRAFHIYLQDNGLTPEDFGVQQWSQIAPLMVWGRDDNSWMHDKQQAMLAYWTRRFNGYSSAQLFSELRKTAREQNAKKRAVLASGDTTSNVATQPWHYPGAMRGNTFLMGGHSLDFFNFYRVADNAFVYETSNRDARVWSWDSYLCDVGRVVTAQPEMGQELFGVFVKPHRGAGMQRGLSAVSRGARYINWYTYGPPYAKGDTWGHRDDILATVARTNRLVAAAEDTLYGGTWAVPPQIAVVKPRASEIWMHLSGNAPMWTAAWENAKWVYTALTHAHLPVDPIDQVMIREKDLSQYKVIYINGPALESAAAKKLAQWVEAGGTLVTMGFGLARDEYNQPLEFMQPVLGLTDRTEPEMWHNTTTYRATSLQEYGTSSRMGDPPLPKVTRVTGQGLLDGTFDLTVGREVLQPAEGSQVIANYADGGAAAIHHHYGQGNVFTIGFFAGLEYVVPLMHDRFDMHQDFDAARRQFVTAPAMSKVKPVVAISEPTIEGILIRHPETGEQAITLMNWAYGVTGVRVTKSAGGDRERPIITHLPAKNVALTVRTSALVRSVHSVTLGKDLSVRPSSNGDGFTVTLPTLGEGDILLLH